MSKFFKRFALQFYRDEFAAFHLTPALLTAFSRESGFGIAICWGFWIIGLGYSWEQP